MPVLISVCDIWMTRVYPALKSVSSIFVRGAEQSLLAVSCGDRGSPAVSPPLAESRINTKRKYFTREACSRSPAAALGQSRRRKCVGCLDCAAPQSSAARKHSAEKPPLGRVARDGSIFRGMPSGARRGSLARLPKGKAQESPKSGIFTRPLIQIRDRHWDTPLPTAFSPENGRTLMRPPLRLRIRGQAACAGATCRLCR